MASESLRVLRKSDFDGLREGLRHAAIRNQSAFLLPFWAGLAEGTFQFEGFVAAARARRSLSYLTIDTTGACDLKCAGMCYYNPAIPLNRATVAEPALVEAIQEAARDLDMRVLAFAGKEPFLNAKRLFRLIAEAAQVPDRSFLIGIVSNGRHIATHADALLRATRKQLEHASTEERDAIGAATARLEASMRDTDYNRIRDLTEELNQLTTPLAERLMDGAIKTALEQKRIDDIV